MCFPYAKIQAKLEENGHFQAVFKLQNASIYSEMSKIHLKGPLTFAKDSKNAKGFISMQIVTKIRILSEKLLYYYRIAAKS